MPLFSYLYRNALWVAPPLFVLGLVLLVLMIVSVVRVTKRARLITIPLVHEQEIQFKDAGRVVLCSEGPRLSRRFAGLRYDLKDDGRPLEGRTTRFHARTSGISSVRTEEKSYEIPHPGSYTLSVEGIQPGAPPDSEHRIVFVQPHLAKVVAHIIGMVFSAALLIGSMVMFANSLMSPDASWATAKTPVILFAALTGFAGLVFVLSLVGKHQAKAAKQFALSQGWTYSSYADAPEEITELKTRLEKVCPEKEFSLRSTMTSESGKSRIRLFDCAHRVRDWGPNKSSGFACLVECERFSNVTAQVDISAKNPLDKMLVSHQVDMGNSEFARNFVVVSKHPQTAKTVITDSLQTFLLKANDTAFPYREICLGPGGFVVITKELQKPAEWVALGKFARELEAALEEK